MYKSLRKVKMFLLEGGKVDTREGRMEGVKVGAEEERKEGR